MSLDPSGPIPPLESATIRAALAGIVTSACSILATVGVSASYIDEIEHTSPMAISVALSLVNIYLGCKTIRARINATATIKKG